jgi:hypothetical protein
VSQPLTYLIDGGLTKLEVDREVELVSAAHGLVDATCGEVHGRVVEKLLCLVLAGGDEPVPFRRAGVRPELEDTGAEATRLVLGDVSQVVDLAHRGVQLGARLGGEAEDEVALDRDAVPGQPSHHRARHFRCDPLAHVRQQPFTVGLDAERDFAAAVTRQQLQHIVAHAVQDVDSAGGVQTYRSPMVASVKAVMHLRMTRS